MARIEQEDNGKKGRFTIYEKDIIAGHMTYTWAGKDKFIIDHTEVEGQFAGKRYGKKLVIKAIEFARAKGVKILPLCTFTKKVFDTDSGLNDVIYRLSTDI